MGRWIFNIFIAIVFIGAPQLVNGQCYNCDVQFPAGTFSTTSNSLVEAVSCAWGGEYSVYNVTAGETYTWTTCGGGAWDTQLTLFSGTNCGSGPGFLVYNDDACGLQSTITWTATFTGQVNLLITQFNCQWNTSCMTIDWACTSCGGGGGDITTCSDTFYDTGGPGGEYSNFEDYSVTYCPANSGECTSADFISFNVENNFDFLYVYDGNSTAAPLLGVYTGTISPGTITATTQNPSGCLTFLFQSDFLFTEPGWVANISCATCVDPPPASQQDCNGAATICDDSSFSGNSSGFGVQELDASNQGCIIDGEDQSSWFFFSPQSTGTIAFMLNPTPIVDYDFAIWGPYDEPICPPPGQPIRCSWSGALVPTGLAAGAGQNSEGAGGDGVVNPITVGPAQVGQVYILLIDNFSATTTPFDFNWNLSGGMSLDCTVLPVDMLAFSGKRLNGENVLEWQTASEVNADYFSIERADNARNFETIGQVPATGNSNTVRNYTYSDPYSGESAYYRLKQVDFDGAYEYYGPVAIHGDGSGMLVDEPFPNPMTDDWINLNISTPTSTEVTVSIHDLTGRILKSETYALGSGSQLLQIELSEYASGAYQLKVADNQHNLLHTARIIR